MMYRETWSRTCRKPAAPAGTASPAGLFSSSSNAIGGFRNTLSTHCAMEPQQIGPILRELAPLVERGEPFDLESLAAEVNADELFLRVLLFRLEESGYLRREADVVTQASLVLLAEPAEHRAALREVPAADYPQVIAALEEMPVYRRMTVELPSWAREIGVEPEVLDRALVELAVRGLASYRPFGRAIRCSPGPRFAEDRLDLAADDPLIKGKQAKLQRMLAFARSDRTCRREALLKYLGQTYRKPEGGCGGCDVCGATADVPWRNERLADVPNPSLLFDHERVTLELIDANVARAAEERQRAAQPADPAGDPAG